MNASPLVQSHGQPPPHPLQQAVQDPLRQGVQDPLQQAVQDPLRQGVQDPLRQGVQAELEQIEQLLHESRWTAQPLVPAVTSHLVDGGGKRIRPLLCLLAARLCQVSNPIAVRLGTVAELIHTASLLHDDVVDGAQLRRGRPAAPQVFGNSLCVLVGDALLARALMLLADLEQRSPLVSLSRCVRTMALAEIQQLARAAQPRPGLLGYFRIVQGKTAALFAWCCTVGELCPADYAPALRRFGLLLGTVFQITDDILDVQGDPARTGKLLGADLREGKLSLPLHCACLAEPRLLEHLRAAAQSGTIDATTLKPLLEEVRRSGGVERAMAISETLLARAHRTLDALPHSCWRQHLHDLVDQAARRAA